MFDGIGVLADHFFAFCRMPDGVTMTEPIPGGKTLADLKAELAKFGIVAWCSDVQGDNVVTFRVPGDKADKARWALQRWNAQGTGPMGNRNYVPPR